MPTGNTCSNVFMIINNIFKGCVLNMGCVLLSLMGSSSVINLLQATYTCNCNIKYGWNNLQSKLPPVICPKTSWNILLCQTELLKNSPLPLALRKGSCKFDFGVVQLWNFLNIYLRLKKKSSGVELLWLLLHTLAYVCFFLMGMEWGAEKIHHKINLCFQSSSPIIGAQKVDLKKKSLKSICRGKSFPFIQESTYVFFIYWP